MAKTSLQLSRQIEALRQQADALKRKESVGVVARIRVAIEFYGLTAADLGFTETGGSQVKTPNNGKHVATKQNSVTASQNTPKGNGVRVDRRKGKRPSVIRYRDANGNSWTGMGRKPGWLEAGLASGKSLSDFAVAEAAQAPKPH